MKISKRVRVKRMILLRKNSLFSKWISELKNESYLKINLILAGVVIGIMVYSGFYSPYENKYPVKCIHERLTGQQCASCGISHSFSLILRGRIGEANEWNPYGMRVFIFFAAQLLMRLLFSAYYTVDRDRRKNLILYDIAGSATLFIISFFPFIRQLADGLLA